MLEDFIQYTDGFTNPNLPLVINPNSSFVGFTSPNADNRDMNNNPLPGNKTTPYLFTIDFYEANTQPTDISQGTIQLSYTLGTDPTVITRTYAFGVTPEPGTLALLGSGSVSGGLLLARRRRRK